MNIELNSYGFMVDTRLCYIALSWGLIVTLSLVTALTITFKKWNNRK